MVKRALIFVHRWLGVALCLLFLIWFPSGIAMMYVGGFPSVSPEDRLERAPAIDPAKVVLSPSEAAARLGVDSLPTHLDTFDGRPAYRFNAFGDGRIVYADTGEEQTEVSRFMLHRAAAAWTGKPADAATVTRLDGVDQWTVNVNLSGLRPVWKYSWVDGEQVYVSAATGEVIQHTTTASRIGAWLGPIPHWFYFKALRQHGPEWSRVVIWSSGIGTLAAIIGIVVGVWIYSPSRRYRYAGAPARIPYYGQKRWHTIFGLIFGVATVTWAFSGMLSMDPFPVRYGAEPDGPDVEQALRGDVDFAADSFAAKHPREALTQVGRPVKELELATFAGEPVYLSTLAGGDTRVVPLDGAPAAEFDRDRIVELVRAAAPGTNVTASLLDQYDRYYLDRHRQRPLPVILAEVDDASHSRYYIDPKTAQVVQSYNDSEWVVRWLYNGLHSLNFPWLYNYRPLWDIVVIAFMLGGTALCVTSLVLAWRVVGRKIAAITVGRPEGRPLPEGDVA